jgi:hypothetical protein
MGIKLLDKDPLTMSNILPPWEAIWLQNGQELIKNSPDLIDNTAKTLITIISTVTAIYTGALALVSITDKSFVFPTNLIFLIPYVPFLISIYFSVIVINPRILKFKPDDVDGIKNLYRNVIEYKYKLLKGSISSFVFALFLVLFLVIALPYYANFIGQTTMVQFLIPENNTVTFETMGFTVDEVTHMTNIVELKDDTEPLYSVILNNKTIVFNKDKVMAAFCTKVRIT